MDPRRFRNKARVLRTKGTDESIPLIRSGKNGSLSAVGLVVKNDANTVTTLATSGLLLTKVDTRDGVGFMSTVHLIPPKSFHASFQKLESGEWVYDTRSDSPGEVAEPISLATRLIDEYGDGSYSALVVTCEQYGQNWSVRMPRAGKFQPSNVLQEYDLMGTYFNVNTFCGGYLSDVFGEEVETDYATRVESPSITAGSYQHQRQYRNRVIQAAMPLIYLAYTRDFFSRAVHLTTVTPLSSVTLWSQGRCALAERELARATRLEILLESKQYLGVLRASVMRYIGLVSELIAVKIIEYNLLRGGYFDTRAVEAECTCTICMTDHPAGTVLAETPCGHHFDGDCIRRWVVDTGSSSCPNCRAVIV